ncbi:hypothetical protein SAMN05428938_7976 [Streptomyces sp. KS_5]|nr:hypothetical protein SAMN05428938_7976 [Streptomyces sp. KS_5]
MTATLVAVVLSLISAVAYAAAAVAQERLAARSSHGGMLRLLGAGAWWASVALNTGAALLHVVALKYGPLTVVQPLGALTLVAAVPMGARAAGRKVRTAEWQGTALTLAGLAALLVAASGAAPAQVLTLTEALAVAGTTAALIGMLSRPGARPGLRHAAASGFASGVASALTQTVTVTATDSSGSVLSVRVVVVTVLVTAFAAGGLLLSQTAYKGGLGGPLAVLALSNPMAASAIGLTLLGQGLRGGAAGVLLGLAGAALASWGVVLLTRVTRSAPPDEKHPVAAGLALHPGTDVSNGFALPLVPGREAGPHTGMLPTPASALWCNHTVRTGCTTDSPSTASGSTGPPNDARSLPIGSSSLIGRPLGRTAGRLLARPGPASGLRAPAPADQSLCLVSSGWLRGTKDRACGERKTLCRLEGTHSEGSSAGMPGQGPSAGPVAPFDAQQTMPLKDDRSRAHTASPAEGGHSRSASEQPGSAAPGPLPMPHVAPA